MDDRTKYLYKIKKLADGNCWMVQNLSLKGKGGTPIETAKGSSYNLPSAVTACGSTNPTCFVEGSTTRTSTSATDDAVNTNTGSYFSWDIATVGTGGAYGQSTNGSTGVTEAFDSVCPKGWSLPTGGPSGQFNTLYTNLDYNDYAKFTAVWSQAFVGNYSTYGLSNNNGNSIWLSSTQYDGEYSYSMFVDDRGFNSVANNFKRVGFSVRCVVASAP